MKRLLSFLFRFSPGWLGLALVLSILTGAANAGLIAIVNRAIAGDGGGSGTASGALIWAFVALCVALPMVRVASEILICHLAQSAIFELRLSLSRQILQAPLRQLEEYGASRLLATLTNDVMSLSNALVLIPYLSMNLAIFVFCFGYLAVLYWPAAVGVLVATCFGVLLFQLIGGRAQHFFADSRRELDALYHHFEALTEGTKELKLHRGRRQAFLSQVLETTAGSFRRHFVTANAYFASAGSLGHILFFVAIGVLVFVLPSQTSSITREVVTGYTLALLYLIVPLTALTSAMPTLGMAVVSLRKIESLGLSLADLAVERNGQPLRRHAWRRLELAGVTHSYYLEKEDRAFTLGPIDLAFEPGELTFLIGGNGSGKTTLAKLLCGLYPPEDGEVRLDETVITDADRDAYRQSFSAVFSDFYLFESLLGIDGRQLDRKARGYLEKLQLDHKVKVEDGALSTLALSQGQRKRLALLTAYLEDRPIYLFDEWAADQDPIFKEIFYDVLLPELKDRGKTVLVISHDDRYYGIADRVIKLEYGQIEYDRAMPAGRPPRPRALDATFRSRASGAT